LTLDSVREILSNRIISAWATYAGSEDLFIEGVQEPDLNSQENPFAMFSVDLPDIRQADMNGDNPLQRGFSFVRVSICAKAGGGTKPLFTMLEIVRKAFAVQMVDSIRLYGITSKQMEPAVGWQLWSVSVPIQFDSIT